MRFRTTFLGAIYIICVMGTPNYAESQSAAVQTVADFLAVCRADQSACISYVSGVLDGGTMAEARNGIPYRYCTRGASYLEIANAYLAFLATEQTRRNTAIL